MNNSIRINKEYFGYVVGYPSGDIVIAKDTAGQLLLEGAGRNTLAEKGMLLESFEVAADFYLKTPPLVWVELTRRCNLSCPHCYIDGGEARKDELPSEWFFSLLDDLAEMGVWAVAFTGGEPTLHPEFSRLVNYARELGMLVGVATNGMFLTEELLSSLRKDGVILSVSLDNLHVMGKSKSAEFRMVTRAIVRAHQSGFRTNIMTNINRQNLQELDDLFGWAKANGVSIRSVPFSPLGRGKVNKKELELTGLEAFNAADFWVRECEWEHEYHKEVGLCVGAIFNYGLSLAYMTNRCSSGRFLAYVCADGVVYPCTMCAGEKILSPGSVRHKKFSLLWNDVWEIRSFNWERFEDTCKGCPIHHEDYYCAARCPATSHARHKTYFGCGASEFEMVSTVVRTSKLKQTESGRSSGIPIVDITSNYPTGDEP